MAGFGGSASLALLTGIFQGQNKAAEEKREAERQRTLNRLAEQQVTESQQRIVRQQREMKNAARVQAQEAAREVQEEDNLQKYHQTIGGIIQRNNPDLTMDEAIAIAQHAPAGTLNRYLDPQSQEELSALDQIRAEQVAEQVRESRRENDMEEGIMNLQNSPEGLRLRTALLNGDAVGLRLARTSAMGSPADGIPGHDPAVIDAYLERIQPKNEDGTVRLTTQQGRAARARGAQVAEALIQRTGSIEAAIAATTRQIDSGVAGDDPYADALLQETLVALEAKRQERNQEEGMDAVQRGVTERLGNR